MRKERTAMIIVVGTSHTIQTTDMALQPFLENLCQKFNVRAVAEEMSEEALAEKDRAASIPMRVAKTLQIPYRFCDPDRTQRATLGIRQENDIRLEAFLSNSALSEAEIATRLADSHAKREQYWLNQLRDFNVWPVLFVCGADHVASFSQLLKRQGMTVHVAAEDWASHSTVERDAPQAAHPSL